MQFADLRHCGNARHTEGHERPQNTQYGSVVSWWTYVTRTSGTDSPKAMAVKTRIDGPHFSKWKNGVVPGPQIAATFARAYGRPVLEAFVAAGFLTPAEANERPVAAPSLDSLSDDELVDEIRRRMLRAGDGDARRDAAPMKSASAPLAVAARRTGRPTAREREAEVAIQAELARRAADESPESADENPLTGDESA